MRNNARRVLGVIASIVCAALLLSAIPAGAEEPTGPGRPLVVKLLKAIEVNDYDGFIAEGNDAVKAGLTKQMFEGVNGLMAPRMKKGYDYSYLGELKQAECQVYLWKLTFKDGGDDTLVKLVLKDGKVAGFWLQ